MAERKKILLVEDNSDIQDNLTMFLNLENFEVASAFDGKQGLDVLRSSGDVCAILLDLMMPGMNGYEFLRERQGDPQLVKIPVILLSAATDLEKTAKTYQLPFVRKPIDLDQLMQSIHKVCPL